MGVEIERRFLVVGDAWRQAVARTTPMSQGYLGGERCAIRLRIAGDGARLTFKDRRAGRSRLEFEYPVPRADAEAMLEAWGGARVEKRRHEVLHAGARWEIDEFLGDNAGLVIAELELDGEDQDFARPAWLGPEVTDDERYSNAALAQNPWRHWR